MNKRIGATSIVVAAGAAWLGLRWVAAPATPIPQSTENARTSAEVSGEALPIANASAARHQPPPSRSAAADNRQAADRIRAVIAGRRAEALGPIPNDHPRATGGAKAGTSTSGAAAPRMPAPVGSSNQVNEALGRYVQDRIRKDFFPMGSSCYEQLLAKHPGARGTVVFDVTIVGDPSVGGVVDAVELDPGSTLKDEQFVVCMRESMFAMPFDAPPAGQEKVTFTYPMELSPDPPTDAAASPQRR